MMRAHPFLVLLAAFALACGRPTTPEPSVGATDFPHPATYGETATHGADAAASGAVCTSCHDSTAEGSTPEVSDGPAACDSCHEAWPHAADFRTGAAHGPAWLADATSCAGCHGEDGANTPADNAAAACTACHSTYPHATGWDLAGGHGPAVRARGGADACVDCHNAEAAQAERAPACDSCHAAYPHADGWDHASTWAADSGDSCGTSCHPAVAEQGQVACSSCHDLFPHADDWTTGHAATVQKRGEAACTTCHEDGDLLGPTLPRRCGSCHAGGGR
jgi:hypothetical protein